ncbi:hypothetical protein ACP0HM_35750 [Escherichia coli]
MCGLCRASILAGLAGDARVRFAAAVTRSLLPVCRDFSGRSPAQVSRSHPPTPASRVRQGCGFPLRPVHPRLIARLFMEARHRPVSRNM